VSYWAYIDESEAELSSGESAYVIAATFIADTDRADIRERMISLKPSHLKKVHWYEEPSPRRAKLVAEIADFQALHQVVVRWCGDHESQERRRRQCLEVVLRELDIAGVTQVLIEARENKQNLRERQWVNDLRSGRRISSRLRVDHVAGPAEPLLWIPDIVAGTVNDQLKGSGQHVLALQDVLTVLTIG